MYAAAGVVVLVDPASIHDEGLLSLGGSWALGEAFLPVLFFQKIRPVASLFYLPFARLGFSSFLVAHLVVATATVPLLAAVARCLGIRSPNVAAAVAASSPLLVWSGPTGLANSDGVAAIALGLYLLLVQRWTLVAGLVLGASCWIRYEVTPLALVLVGVALIRDRSWRTGVGAAIWPVAYLASGAFYHGDALWFLHFPPALSTPMPGNETWVGSWASHDLGSAVFGLLAMSFAVPVAMLARWSKLGIFERALAMHAGAFCLLFVVAHLVMLPFGQLWILGLSARYVLPALPAVAILAARAADDLREGLARAVHTVVLGGAASVGAAIGFRSADPTALVSAVCAGVALVLGRLRLGRAAAISIMIGSAVGSTILGERMRDAGFAASTDLPALVTWLEADRARGRRGAVITNVAQLRPYVTQSRKLSGAEVHYVLGVDQVFELEQLSNPNNRQREIVASALARGVFGAGTMSPATLSPGTLEPKTLVVLRDDKRNRLTFPPEVWDSALQPIQRIGRYVVFEVR